MALPVVTVVTVKMLEVAPILPIHALGSLGRHVGFRIQREAEHGGALASVMVGPLVNHGVEKLPRSGAVRPFLVRRSEQRCRYTAREKVSAVHNSHRLVCPQKLKNAATTPARGGPAERMVPTEAGAE